MFVCLKLTAAGDEEEKDAEKPEENESDETESEMPELSSTEKPADVGTNSIASEIAGMISEINNS